MQAGRWLLDRIAVSNHLDLRPGKCHSPQSQDPKAAKFDLSPARAYDALVSFGKPSLQDQVWEGYRRGFSVEGEGVARRSALLALLNPAEGHQGVKLDAESLERFVVWMDTYAQRAGAFDAEQEKRLEELRQSCAGLLLDRQPKQTKTGKTARVAKENLAGR